MELLDALKKLAGEALDLAGNVAEAAAGIVDDVTDEANDLFSKAEQKVTETVAAHSSAEKTGSSDAHGQTSDADNA